MQIVACSPRGICECSYQNSSIVTPEAAVRGRLLRFLFANLLADEVVKADGQAQGYDRYGQCNQPVVGGEQIQKQLHERSLGLGVVKF